MSSSPVSNAASAANERPSSHRGAALTGREMSSRRWCDKLPQPIQTARSRVTEDRDAGTTTRQQARSTDTTHVDQRTAGSHATTCRTSVALAHHLDWLLRFAITDHTDAAQDSNVRYRGTAVRRASLRAPSKRGRVTGRVLDQTGGSLPGVTIDLVIRRNGADAVSDADRRVPLRARAGRPGGTDVSSDQLQPCCGAP